jgi:hypothetical protein
MSALEASIETQAATHKRSMSALEGSFETKLAAKFASFEMPWSVPAWPMPVAAGMPLPAAGMPVPAAGMPLPVPVAVPLIEDYAAFDKHFKNFVWRTGDDSDFVWSSDILALCNTDAYMHLRNSIPIRGVGKRSYKVLNTLMTKHYHVKAIAVQESYPDGTSRPTSKMGFRGFTMAKPGENIHYFHH